MNGIYNINNDITKIAKEHTLITEYVVSFNKSLKNRDKNFFKGIASFLNFLEKELLAHFRFEEIVIFPAALIGEPKYGHILMVMTLQKEHGILENRLQLLTAKIKHLQTSQKKLSNELIEEMSVFFDDLKTHAKREMTDLFPMMDANPKVKALIEVYAKEMTNV